MIKTTLLHKSFGTNHVLKGVNLEISEGGIFAILGPNSSGKTTLIKSILGMVIPQSGLIEVNGINTKKDFRYRNTIGYLPQIARFPQNLRVMEVLNMIRNLRLGEKRCDELIRLFGLQEFLDKKLGNLSGGTIQKVNIVQAFMFDSPILFLDEPTAGLDPVSLIKLKGLIGEEKKKGKIILITTHIMTLVEELADELVFLLEGKVHYRGKPMDLIRKYCADNLEIAIARMVEGSFQAVSANGQSEKKMIEELVK